jgi:hypothetical protein
MPRAICMCFSVDPSLCAELWSLPWGATQSVEHAYLPSEEWENHGCVCTLCDPPASRARGFRIDGRRHCRLPGGNYWH